MPFYKAFFRLISQGRGGQYTLLDLTGTSNTSCVMVHAIDKSGFSIGSSRLWIGWILEERSETKQVEMARGMGVR